MPELEPDRFRRSRTAAAGRALLGMAMLAALGFSSGPGEAASLPATPPAPRAARFT